MVLKSLDWIGHEVLKKFIGQFYMHLVLLFSPGMDVQKIRQLFKLIR